MNHGEEPKQCRSKRITRFFLDNSVVVNAI